MLKPFVCITNGSNSTTFAVIYRPPPSPANGLKTKDFLEEMNSFLTDLNLLPIDIYWEISTYTLTLQINLM